MRVGSIFSCLKIAETAAPAGAHQDGKQVAALENGKLQQLGLQEDHHHQQQQQQRGSLWLQFAAAISASLAVMACGGYLGWTSPALPHLTGPSSPFPVTVYQGSWIASLYTLGGIAGSLLSPLLIDRFGRKWSLLLFAIPQLAGWGLIIPAKSYRILYVARFVAGIAHGGVYNVAVIYFAEIADKDIRGAFGTLLKMCTNLGTLFVTTAGAFLSYEQLNLASLALPVLFVCTFVFMPESPYYYLIHNQEDKATKTLLRLRRLDNPESVCKDIQVMHSSVVESRRSGESALRELFFNKGNRRGLWILLSLKVTQQFSGHMAVVAYTQEIFSHSGSKLAPQHAVIVLGLAQLLAGLLAASIVDRVGRRILILFSGTSAALSLFFVGLFFYLKYGIQVDVSMITWLPIIALIAYEIMVALGIGTVPYVILGEIFPTNVKGPAVASGIIIGSIFAFVVGLGFQALNSVAGIHTTFWFFSGCCIAGTLWVYAITPETKGKTLEEIQAVFNPKVEKNVNQT